MGVDQNMDQKPGLKEINAEGRHAAAWAVLFCTWPPQVSAYKNSLTLPLRGISEEGRYFPGSGSGVR